MRLNVLFFAAGVWSLQRQAALPDMAGLWLPCAALLVAALLRRRGTGTAIVREVLLKAACLGLGFYWAAGYAHVRLAESLPAEREGKDVTIVGVVASLPQPHERSVRFEFDVERVLTASADVPRHIALAWWGTPVRDGRAATFPQLEAGERWQITVRLRRPRGAVNPGGFDYEAWLLERGLRATGYVRPHEGNRRLDGMVHRPVYWVERARGGLRDRIRRALPDAPYTGVLVALAVGEQRAITPAQWQVFTRTGVNHLMSISGLHVTMISSLAFALACALWRRNHRLVLALPARKAGVAIGLVAAFGYALLSGFAVPAQRTLYMLAVAAFALWRGKTGSVSTVLAAALAAVLLLDPWAVLAPGFWLSFGAVAVIMYVTVGRIGQPHWIVNWARVQWAVTLALVPPLIAMFQQVSIVSPLANAVAIPLVSLVVVPLTLAGMVLPFDFVLQLAHHAMSACMWLLESMSMLPASVWQQHAPPVWTVGIALAGIAWTLLPRGFPARWLGAVALMPLFLAGPPSLAPGELRLTVLDVGHGLAVVARTRHHALLYDTGPAFGPGADSGNRIIVPYLRAAGVRSLDAMVVSHDDADHSGGAASVMQALPVRRLLTSLPDVSPLVPEAGAAPRCYAGQQWEWDGVRFEILHPAPASYDDARRKDNDRSCVLHITAPGGRVLLPADIERRSEGELLRADRERLAAEVLVVPHQGSRSSSTPDFVEAVQPRLAAFPVGYRNRFGHPHPDVVARYRALGSDIYRTDRDGALTFTMRPDGVIRVDPHRAAYRRYWHTRVEGEPVREPAETRSGR